MDAQSHATIKLPPKPTLPQQPRARRILRFLILLLALLLGLILGVTGVMLYLLALSGIPITGFVSNFESQLNQQLESGPSNLPKGFVYCKTSVRTDPQGVYITISATPV